MSSPQEQIITGGLGECSPSGCGGPAWTVGGRGCGSQEERKNTLTGKAVLACSLRNQEQKTCEYAGRNS